MRGVRSAAGPPRSMEASSKGGADGTKKNLPLLRAVKDGKTSAITSLLESGEVDVNFQNHCKAPANALNPRPKPPRSRPRSLIVLACVCALACARSQTATQR